MKNIKLLLIGLIVTFVLASCGGSSNDNPTPEPEPGTGNLTGEWHLVSWSTLASADVYLSFTDTGSFDIYQRLYAPEYTHFKGTYSYGGQTLSGTYSDSKPWGSSYLVSFYSNGTQMRLTSVTSPGDVSVFVKATIPSEITSGELGTSALGSRVSEETPRFL